MLVRRREYRVPTRVQDAALLNDAFGSCINVHHGNEQTGTVPVMSAHVHQAFATAPPQQWSAFSMGAQASAVVVHPVIMQNANGILLTGKLDDGKLGGVLNQTKRTRKHRLVLLCGTFSLFLLVAIVVWLLMQCAWTGEWSPPPSSSASSPPSPVTYQPQLMPETHPNTPYAPLSHRSPRVMPPVPLSPPPTILPPAAQWVVCFNCTSKAQDLTWTQMLFNQRRPGPFNGNSFKSALLSLVPGAGTPIAVREKNVDVVEDDTFVRVCVAGLSDESADDILEAVSGPSFVVNMRVLMNAPNFRLLAIPELVLKQISAPPPNLPELPPPPPSPTPPSPPLAGGFEFTGANGGDISSGMFKQPISPAQSPDLPPLPPILTCDGNVTKYREFQKKQCNSKRYAHDSSLRFGPVIDPQACRDRCDEVGDACDCWAWRWSGVNASTHFLKCFFYREKDPVLFNVPVSRSANAWWHGVKDRCIPSLPIPNQTSILPIMPVQRAGFQIQTLESMSASSTFVVDATFVKTVIDAVARIEGVGDEDVQVQAVRVKALTGGPSLPPGFLPPSPLGPPPPERSVCLPGTVTISTIDFLWHLNGVAITKKLGVGIGAYKFTNVPGTYPLAIVGGNSSAYAHYKNEGSEAFAYVDGELVPHYTGSSTLIVTDDFDSASVHCSNHGYMGGEKRLKYNVNCSPDARRLQEEDQDENDDQQGCSASKTRIDTSVVITSPNVSNMAFVQRRLIEVLDNLTNIADANGEIASLCETAAIISAKETAFKARSSQTPPSTPSLPPPFTPPSSPPRSSLPPLTPPVLPPFVPPALPPPSSPHLPLSSPSSSPPSSPPSMTHSFPPSSPPFSSSSPPLTPAALPPFSPLALPLPSPLSLPTLLPQELPLFPPPSSPPLTPPALPPLVPPFLPSSSTPSPPSPATPPSDLPEASPPEAMFSCFGAALPNTIISSNAISSHASDVDALAACVSALSCYGVVYASANSESTRWSTRIGGEGVLTFRMSGVTSYVYSGSCRRRLNEKPLSPLMRLARLFSSVPDDHALTVRPARGPLWKAAKLNPDDR